MEFEVKQKLKPNEKILEIIKNYFTRLKMVKLNI